MRIRSTPFVEHGHQERLARPILLAGLIGALAATADLAVAGSLNYSPSIEASHPFTEGSGEWRDEARHQRVVPYRVYLPEIKAPVPVVLFSHGLGGSREAASYLGRCLAGQGYAAFHLQHPGTDEGIRQAGGGLQAIRARVTPRALAARYGDIRFAIEQVTGMNQAGPWNGRFDLSAVGVAGHSLGAITALVAAGGKVPGQGQDFAVPSIKGAFVMSPAARRDDAEEAFAELKPPIFHLTGTHDESAFGDMQPEDRLIPFRSTTAVDQFLIVFDRGVHATFSGRQIDDDPFLDRHHEAICVAAIAFWDATLRASRPAMEFLQSGQIKARLDELDRYEFKPAKPATNDRKTSY